MVQNYSNNKRNELLEQFLNQEILFRELIDEFDTYINSYITRFSMAEIWTDAKTFVQELFKSNYPQKRVWNLYKQLLDDYSSFISDERDNLAPQITTIVKINGSHEYKETINLILLCSYCMLHYEYIYNLPFDVDYKVKISESIDKIKECIDPAYYTIGRQWTKIIDKLCSDKITKDYDYLNNKVIKAIKDTNTDTIKTASIHSNQLSYYKEHPIYGICYKGLVYSLSILGNQHKLEYIPDDYVIIYKEVVGYINEAMTSEFPDISISNIHSRIRKKYNNNTELSEDNKLCCDIVGCLIEMTFLICLWDMMPEKSEEVLNEFMTCRIYIQDVIYSGPYTHNPMWGPLCERIPRMENPITQDLYAEIERLRNKLSIYEESNEPQINLKPLVIDPHNKVRLEVMMKLLESSNVDLKTRGNKAETARLLECLTGLPLSTCQNYVTNRDLNKDTHKEEITAINSQLEKLKITWRI